MSNTHLSSEEYKAIVEQSPIMIWRSNTTSKCDYFNGSWYSFTGRTVEQELGDGWIEGIHQHDMEKFITVYSEAFRKREIFEIEYRLRRYDGQYLRILNRGAPFKDNEGKFAGYIGSCIDMTENIERENKLFNKDNELNIIVDKRTAELKQKMEDLSKILERRLAIDPITGVYNYLKFNEILARETNKARRYSIYVSLIMFGIDDFKVINDTYGHQTGDIVLKKIVRLISDNIRDTDIFARWGGDEFMILTSHNDRESAAGLAEKLRDLIKKANFGGIRQITCSFGVVQFRNNEDLDSFVKRANNALYKAKNSGKDKVEICLEDIDEKFLALNG